MSKKIYINPGHSDKDPGAVGIATERILNVKTAEFMNDYLQKHYICQTRMNPGTMNTTRQVAEDANSWKADLMVSIHFNAGGGDGYEALVFSDTRVTMGKFFERQVKQVGQNSRGVKLRPDLNILRLTNMPAIVNEGAFVDNKADIRDWDQDPELEKLGIAYAKAAAEYLKLEAIPQQPEVLYTVQVGQFRERGSAESMQIKLKTAGFTGSVVKLTQ